MFPRPKWNGFPRHLQFSPARSDPRGRTFPTNSAIFQVCESCLDPSKLLMSSVEFPLLKGEGLGVRSDLRGATIYEEVGPGHVTALVRREENHRVSDLIRCPDSAQWRRGGYAFLDLIDLRVAHARPCVAWRDDRAGAHHVDADSASLEIHPPGPREGPQSSFRRRIDAERRHTFD